MWYNIYTKTKEIKKMLVAIIVLAWLLVSTWITLAVICIDEGHRGSEWVGIVLACLFSPISVLIIRPIVLAIKKAKRRKKDVAH